LDELLATPGESNAILARYYTERAQAMQEKIARHWRDGSIRNTPFAQQTIIQVFSSSDGSHREEDSVYARVGHEAWKDVRIELPPGAGAAPLRIDFVSALTTIEIRSIRLITQDTICFVADPDTGFDMIRVAGDAERIAGHALRLRVTGIDPQLYLPAVNLPPGDAPLIVHMHLCVL
jgi:hypothetical protein